MQKIAVFFGGRSYEHDVSVLTGLQVCQVIDITKFQPIPVYVNKVGRMFVGEQLLNPRFYPVLEFRESQLTEIIIPVGETEPVLQHRFGFFKKKIPFDAAFLAFHGGDGESGGFQGLLQTAGIPYTGADVRASAVYMDKVLTKQICRTLEIPVLDDAVIARPLQDFYDIKKILADFALPFPVMAKPRSLGSSVGIHRCENIDDLAAACINIFKLGDDALVGPFVPNLEEYNIAVIKNESGEILTSVIERPTSGDGKALSFADKYLGDGGKKKKKAVSVMPTRALIESRREFSPKLTPAQESQITDSAVKLFTNLGACGCPRIDFISNGKTGEIWLNEANPIPGSFAFYLWQQKGINYQQIVDMLLANLNYSGGSVDLKQAGAVVFK